MAQTGRLAAIGRRFGQWLRSARARQRILRGGGPDLDEAHKHCFDNRNELQASAYCGCFYCGAIFKPSEIEEWIDADRTAMCPFCPVDAVIGDASGYPITREFLQSMHDRWF